ncbi:unnamed protein product [Pleuronectes platessa]|uniref:Uncharacterized protein n=1 Tax=Pleuronectes platessa TaxID=8262 RepID=A0A9N7U2R0_PLEPL|nr:unnamed protein product [Pleuronectes platessa]
MMYDLYRSQPAGCVWVRGRYRSSRFITLSNMFTKAENSAGEQEASVPAPGHEAASSPSGRPWTPETLKKRVAAETSGQNVARKHSNSIIRPAPRVCTQQQERGNTAGCQLMADWLMGSEDVEDLRPVDSDQANGVWR